MPFPATDSVKKIFCTVTITTVTTLKYSNTVVFSTVRYRYHYYHNLSNYRYYYHDYRYRSTLLPNTKYKTKKTVTVGDEYHTVLLPP